MLLLPGPLWPKVVVPVGVSFMGQIDLFKYYLYLSVKIGMKIATHLSANISAYAPRARFFWLEKNMAALNELISQMVMYLHAGSHIKPWRVKMHMQRRAGIKEHKNNECHHSGSFYFCVGQELVWGEAVVSLKREKRIIEYGKDVLASDCRFLQLGDAVATLPGTANKLKQLCKKM